MNDDHCCGFYSLMKNHTSNCIPSSSSAQLHEKPFPRVYKKGLGRPPVNHNGRTMGRLSVSRKAYSDETWTKKLNLVLSLTRFQGHCCPAQDWQSKYLISDINYGHENVCNGKVDNLAQAKGSRQKQATLPSPKLRLTHWLTHRGEV